MKKDDGTLGYGSIQPEMKEALARYAEWYKDGVINSNFTTMDSSPGICGMADVLVRCLRDWLVWEKG